MQKRLFIKFCRFGSKHRPKIRLGVLPQYRNPSKQYALEFIGSYDPITKKAKLNVDRVNYYLSKNIGLTDSVKSLLIKEKIIKQ